MMVVLNSIARGIHSQCMCECMARNINAPASAQRHSNVSFQVIRECVIWQPLAYMTFPEQHVGTGEIVGAGFKASLAHTCNVHAATGCTVVLVCGPVRVQVCGCLPLSGAQQFLA
jgi:hypothetical protein